MARGGLTAESLCERRARVSRWCGGPAACRRTPACMTSAAPVQWRACTALAVLSPAPRSSPSAALAAARRRSGGEATAGAGAAQAPASPRASTRVIDGDTLKVRLGGRAADDRPGARHRHAGDEEAGHARRVRRAAGDGVDGAARAAGQRLRGQGPRRRADRRPDRGPGRPVRPDPRVRRGGRPRPRRAAGRRAGGRRCTPTATGGSSGASRYERAERQARAARRGVWGACGGDFHSSR